MLSNVSAPRRPAASLRIFLLHGTPEGPQIAEKSNWTGHAIKCSRAQYPALRERPEFGRPGLYLLMAPVEGADPPRIYIGEADVARSRLDQHARSKDFWTQLVLFTSKDGNLNKAHVKYLEARLIERTHRARRAQLENGTVPQLPNLSEVDRSDAKAFLEDMLLVYPLLGVRAFEDPAALASESARLHLRTRGIEAEGHEAGEGFLVCAGSQAALKLVPSAPPGLGELRRRLVQQGVLEPGPEAYRFVGTHLFSSPSTAAGVITGRAANGRKMWRDASGRTLKDLQAAALEDAPG